MQICRPELAISRAIDVWESRGGDVVRQGVEPDIHAVAGVVRHWHARLEAGARNRKVAQAAAHEALDLVAPGFRGDEFRMLVVELQQPVLPGGEAEEIARL